MLDNELNMKIEINNLVFNRFPEFESERLLYRNFLIQDAEYLFRIRTDDDVMRFMDMTRFESIQETEKWILSTIDSYNNRKGINWVIVEKSTNTFIGYFGFWRIIPEHCRAEIGYALDPKYWNKGLMTETLVHMMKYGFTKMNLHSVEANVNPLNINSIKVLEKVGFQKEAYFKENFLFNNEFLDSIIYSLLEKNLIESISKPNSL